jgi:hypothetical protein
MLGTAIAVVAKPGNKRAATEKVATAQPGPMNVKNLIMFYCNRPKYPSGSKWPPALSHAACNGKRRLIITREQEAYKHTNG